MRKIKSSSIFLTIIILLLMTFSIPVKAADWDIISNPGSEQITTPPLSATSETTNVGIPAFEGTGMVQEGDTVLPIPDATIPAIPESIIGTDNRSIVSNTTLFPYRTSCLLVITFPDGISYGSGNLISSDTVLTAGHCVYDTRYGGWATRIEVYAGRNGSYSPFGKANSKSFYTLDRWINLTSKEYDYREYDIGYIKLDQKLGKTTGWLGLTTTLSNDISLTGVHAYAHGTVNSGTRMNLQNFEIAKKIADTAILSYRSHVQNIGWQGWVNDTGISGTTGQSKRLEAINLSLSDSSYSGNIEYRAHVQNIGWQGWQKNGAMAGTTGQSNRLEALEIKLTGELAKIYNVRYRSHVQGIGWQAWKSNGQMTGTTGQSLRLEAIQIQLVKK
ncbi:MAG: trypsin-like serine protease [Pseudolactococcus laudensis]